MLKMKMDKQDFITSVNVKDELEVKPKTSGRIIESFLKTKDYTKGKGREALM